MRKAPLFLALAALIIAGVLWQRVPLLAWYYTRQLARATTQDRQPWVDRVAALDERAAANLVGWLNRADSAVAANMQAALTALAARWPADDERSWRLAERLEQDFDRYSSDGQRAALAVLTAVLNQPSPPRQQGTVAFPVPLTRAAGEVLHRAQDRTELRVAVLRLAGALIEHVPHGQWLGPCRTLAHHGLRDRDNDIRLAAIQLLLCEPLRQDQELLGLAVPLLHDRVATIRRAAVVALAPARELVNEDALLPLLHDPDFEVQSVCVVALRSRGLADSQIDLARLISDPNPSARLRVVQQLTRDPDLDAGVWLRRLSQDRVPAVRAAAARAAGLTPQVDLRDRLHDMAQHDPSATVRQLAEHYLRQAKAGR
jgi:hypothetical protein